MKQVGLALAIGVMGWGAEAWALDASDAEPKPDGEGEGQALELPPGWSMGPLTGPLGAQSEVDVPVGFIHMNGPASMQYMESMENPRTGNEVGLVMPMKQEQSWMVLFEFEDVGYVKDDEKDELDADELLSSFKEGTKAGNKNRRERGWEEIEITGWEQAPRYDDETKNLVWAIKGQGLGPDGAPFVNYNVRLLGRRGYTSATVLCAPEDLNVAIKEAEELLTGFRYTTGNTYAEYQEGDKLAEYGLMGLMVGGGAVLAFPLLRKLWFVIVAAVVGVGQFFRKLFFGEKISKGES
ncbi:MAG: DUF2167 domain-containing protein [Myxococcota bacterium]